MSGTTRSESEYLALFDKGIKWFHAGCYVAAYEACHETWTSMESIQADPLIRARSLSGMAVTSFQLGDVHTALKRYQEAIALAESVGLPDHFKLQTLVNLSIAHYWLGSFPEAAEVCQEGQRLVGSEVDPKLRADLHLTMGGATFYIESGQEICLEANRRALDTYEKMGSADGQAMALVNLGPCYTRKGDDEKAYSHLRRAVKLAAQARTPDTLVYACVELGMLHVRRQEADRAIRYGLAAVETLWTNLVVLDKVALAQLSHLFGLIYRDRGDHERALQQLQRASYYFTEVRRWKEWEKVTSLMDEVISDPRPSSRYEMNRRTMERLRYFVALLGLLDSIETTYPHVRLRSQVATHYALMLVGRLGLSRKQRMIMGHAGRLHDVGMTAVDPEVLEKRETMSRAAKRRLEAHVVVGENALRMFKLPEELYAVVRHHHEHYDGSGFPEGLRGEEIPLPARILAVVDRYVELALGGRVWGDETSPDHVVVRHEAAMNRLRQEAGSRLDPALVTLFGELHRSVVGSSENRNKTQEGS